MPVELGGLADEVIERALGDRDVGHRRHDVRCFPLLSASLCSSAGAPRVHDCKDDARQGRAGTLEFDSAGSCAPCRACEGWSFRPGRTRPTCGRGTAERDSLARR